jgi:hypothetical protein
MQSVGLAGVKALVVHEKHNPVIRQIQAVFEERNEEVVAPLPITKGRVGDYGVGSFPVVKKILALLDFAPVLMHTGRKVSVEIPVTLSRF